MKERMIKYMKAEIVYTSSSFFEGIKKLNASINQFILIVDQNEILQGTITDGDIRRAILRGKSLQVPITEVMNPSPIYVSANLSKEEQLAFMKQRKVRQLPLVDENKRVQDVLFYDDMTVVKEKTNTIILMVGGLGTRLRPLTNDLPKPMLPIGGKPILENIIMHFKSFGFVNFILSVNYKKEIIKNYFQDGKSLGVTITYIEETERLGTAGALSLIKEEINEPFFVMNGDLLTNTNYEQLLDFHLVNQATATMCVREYEYQVPYGVIEVDEHKLTSIVEKPVQKHFVNAGIYVLEPDTLTYIPKNQYYDMPELFNYLIQQQKEVAAFPIREYWMDIGQLEDYEMANRNYREGLK